MIMNIKLLSLLPALFWLLTGCATLDDQSTPGDPLESYNRAVYKFNDGIDRYVLKPVAKGYDNVTPDPVQKGISNFFSNLDDIFVIANDLLQLKFRQFASDTARFVINSTLGLGGLIDWASDMGLKKHQEDFGQTLGYWGVPAGPYFMVPFVGPSTIRDVSGEYVDISQFSVIWNELHEGYPRVTRDASAAWGLKGLKTIDQRAALLKAEKVLDEAALDRYSFIRDFYLQRRLNLVHDGNPPQPEPEFNESELFDL